MPLPYALWRDLVLNPTRGAGLVTSDDVRVLHRCPLWADDVLLRIGAGSVFWLVDGLRR